MRANNGLKLIGSAAALLAALAALGAIQQQVDGTQSAPLASLLLRDPMPWEEGYFDPTYHVWPKGRQEQVGEKQSARLASEQTMTGGKLAKGGHSER